jgi:NAD(P)-dependent dehydrogenase (short-subunit alcohol dehydrogenase family)
MECRPSDREQRSSTVLITGCSSGIGLATAVEFACRGATVIATLRDVSRSAPLRDALRHAGCEADIRELDVADDDSVATVVAEVIADHNGIDVVVSNAGVGFDGTTEELTIDDFRALFEVNALGTVRLVQAVMPGWRARGSGRFIAVSSMAGVIGQPFGDAYCTSKFGLEGLLESWAPVAAQFGIAVSLVEPGPVDGVFVDRSKGRTQRLTPDPYAESRERFHALQAGALQVAQTAGDIAALIRSIAQADQPKLRYQSSELVERMVGLKLKDMNGDRVLRVTSRWV